MPTFKQDIHSGRRVPVFSGDDIAPGSIGNDHIPDGALSPEKLSIDVCPKSVFDAFVQANIAQANGLILRMQGRGEYQPHLDFVKWIEFSSATHGDTATATRAMQEYINSLHGTTPLAPNIPIGFVNICLEGRHLLLWNDVHSWDNDQWTQIAFGGAPGESYGVQGIYPSMDSGIYLRRCDNGEWGEWKTYAGSAELVSKADKSELDDLLPCIKIDGVSPFNIKPNRDGVYLQYSAKGLGPSATNGLLNKYFKRENGSSTSLTLAKGNIFYDKSTGNTYIYNGTECVLIGTDNEGLSQEDFEGVMEGVNDSINSLRNDSENLWQAMNRKLEPGDISNLLPCIKVQGILHALSFSPEDGIYLEYSARPGGGMIQEDGYLNKLTKVVDGKHTSTPLVVGKIYYNEADSLCYVFDGTDCKPLGTPGHLHIDVTQLFEVDAEMNVTMGTLAASSLYMLSRGNAIQVQLIDSARGPMLVKDNLSFIADEGGGYKGSISKLCAILFEDNSKVKCTDCFDVSIESTRDTEQL